MIQDGNSKSHPTQPKTSTTKSSEETSNILIETQTMSRALKDFSKEVDTAVPTFIEQVKNNVRRIVA